MKLLHPTDFSACADQGQTQTIRLAYARGGEVIVLHVAVEAPLYGEGPMSAKAVEQVYEAQRKWSTETLERRVAVIREHGLAARWSLKVGVPHEEIVKAAAEESADLIIMGTQGRGGLERFLLASVADRVIRRAPCPVVTVRTTEE